VDVVGPAAVTIEELARIASEVTGDEYRYDPIDEDAWVAKRLAMGRPEWAVQAGLSSYRALRAGELDVTSDDYRALTGEAPLSVAQVIERHRGTMPLSA
jgi:hypothetical protein